MCGRRLGKPQRDSGKSSDAEAGNAWTGPGCCKSGWGLADLTCRCSLVVEGSPEPGGYAITSQSRESGTVPGDWQTGVVVPIFKKGDQRVCCLGKPVQEQCKEESTQPSNLKWRRKNTDSILDVEQKAKWKREGGWDQEMSSSQDSNSGCPQAIVANVDHFFTLARILRLVDLEKAYDHDHLWGALQQCGVSGTLMSAIQSLYNWCESCVHVLARPENGLGSPRMRWGSGQGTGSMGVLTQPAATVNQS